MRPPGPRTDDEARELAQRYRSLYEGSQQSLSDMASRQGEALGRVGRLRGQIVLGLKRILPNEFTEAERALGQRLSEVPDELLTAYLESFLLLLVGRGHAEAGAVARIRQTLEGLGLDTRGATSTADLADALERAVNTGKFGLAELFAPVDVKAGAKSTTELVGTTSTPARHEDGYDQYDTIADGIGVIPKQGNTEAVTPAASSANSNTFTGEDVSTDLGDLFYEDMGADLADLFYEESGFADLFDGEEVAHNIKVETEGTPDEIRGGQDAGVGVVAFEHTNVIPVQGEAVEDGRDHETKDKPPARVATSTLVGPWAKQIPSTGEEVTNRAVAKGGAMKPALLPQSPKTRQRRARTPVKASAMPGESSLDVPMIGENNESVLDDAMRDRLLAAVCIPRPVFAVDLVDMVKSAEVVADWEAEMMSNRDRSVYVIPPKSRHKLRGSLIFSNSYLSDGPSEFQRSLWAQCLGAYRGAKLYEIGVVLHRFGDDVVSYQIGPQVLLLRLSMPQGLVGVIMMLDTGLGEGEPGRDSLIGALETLMKERLVHIAVLSYVAENSDAIAAVVSEEALRRAWAPTMPITLSKSWEYTNGTGSAVPLVG